jgi:hypothetical protein
MGEGGRGVWVYGRRDVWVYGRRGVWVYGRRRVYKGMGVERVKLWLCWAVRPIHAVVSEPTVSILTVDPLNVTPPLSDIVQEFWLEKKHKHG